MRRGLRRERRRRYWGRGGRFDGMNPAEAGSATRVVGAIRSGGTGYAALSALRCFFRDRKPRASLWAILRLPFQGGERAKIVRTGSQDRGNTRAGCPCHKKDGSRQGATPPAGTRAPSPPLSSTIRNPKSQICNAHPLPSSLFILPILSIPWPETGTGRLSNFLLFPLDKWQIPCYNHDKTER